MPGTRASRTVRGSRAVAATMLIVTAALVSSPQPAAGSPPPGRCGDPVARPWCNTSLSPDQRASLLLHALTLDEEVSLLAGVAASGHTGQTPAIDRVGLPAVYITDDGVGVKQGTSTALPIPIALAATFDPSMATLAGGVIANEAKAKGNDVILGPTANIMRTPLGGRTFESHGEDPYLMSRTAVSWIEAAQAQGVIAEVKHYCCNNQEGLLTVAGEKEYSSSDLDERTLREIYTQHFEAAVKDAHVGTVMCAYNRVNEDWSCEQKHLLTDMLKTAWGFPGTVVSDWQAKHNTVLALQNGLDVEMPTPMDYDPNLVKAALTGGLVTQAQVDDHVQRFLRTLFAFGFFDRPAYANNDSQIDTAAHAAAAQQIEEAGMTMLKNAQILPLAGTVKSIALIGPQADRFENGAGTDNITPFTFTTPRQAITQRAGPGVTVTYDDGTNTTTAASTAAAADIAIVFASDSEGEYMDKRCAGVDCSESAVTSNQGGLISTIAAANPNTIVVLETGDPVLTPWLGSVRGLLEAWYPGEQGGTALARVLFGDVEPGGRLPATFPASSTQYPTAGDPTAYPGAMYNEGVFVGYRWYDHQGVTPAFPFGFGLSYTAFSYDQLSIQPGAPGSITVATVTARVTNTGARTGVAVPQLYLGLPSPSATVLQPPHQLRGYQKITLAPGASQTVSFPLNDRAFAYWDVTSSAWSIVPGCYGVYVGSSSRDLPLNATIARGGATCDASAVAVNGGDVATLQAESDVTGEVAPIASPWNGPTLPPSSVPEGPGVLALTVVALGALVVAGSRRVRRKHRT